ncbi:MAG: hypothetical protein DBY45_05770 [Clostridiales bacterium]|nr:MAG: hypothetical protein DBY45_05770 [Clostridiales bacterium]
MHPASPTGNPLLPAGAIMKSKYKRNDTLRLYFAAIQKEMLLFGWLLSCYDAENAALVRAAGKGFVPLRDVKRHKSMIRRPHHRKKRASKGWKRAFSVLWRL